MKTYKSNALNLKKLTVARINVEALQFLKGGSSIPPNVGQGTVRRVNGACNHPY